MSNKNAKRLLLVTENLGSGGAERQLTGLAALLKKAGHEPTIVTWFDRNFFGQFLDEHHVEHILLKPCCKADRVLKLARLFRSHKPDVVISFLPSSNETCVMASFLVPVKLIVSERSFTINWDLRRKLTDILYRRAAHIVANSNNEAENIRLHCPSLIHKVRVIPNYVDVDKFTPLRDCCQSEKTEQIKMMGVGRIIPTKNINRLITALSRVKAQGIDFLFEWYGKCNNPALLNHLTALVNELGLDRQFVFAGESHNIADAYRCADIFCFPSMIEGYPNVVVEAMASELPIVCSNVCEHPYIVVEGENGYLFDPSDIDDMAGAIARMAHLPKEERVAMGRRNRAKIISANSPQSFLDQYLAII